MKDGGSAFPEIETDVSFEKGQDYPRTYSSGGMSLRDWFAGQALRFTVRASTDRDGAYDFAAAAVGAYQLADEMLKAREEQK